MSNGDQAIKVLHLEDVPTDAELVARAARTILPNLAITRVDTREAFAAGLEEHPDIVLLDYNLPQFDGLSALKLIRERDPDLPVIMVTGALGDEAAVELVKAGANYYVLKDRLAGLGQAMRRALNLASEHRSRKAAEAALHGALELMLGAVAGVIGMRDPYTATHQQRVARLAPAIALEMGFEPDYVTGLRLGSLIHDIGKIRVPAEILSRPGTLSPDEFALIKMHCQVGYDVLHSISFPWPIADMVLQHHERLDGSGYPNGRRGDRILPEAKILAVADVVEAMSSHRPYRPALGIEAALDEITRNAGKLYDPDAAAACVTLIRDKGFAFDDNTGLAASPAPPMGAVPLAAAPGPPGSLI